MRYWKVILVLILAGCALVPNYSVVEQEYISNSRSIPTIFWLSPFEIDAAWERAENFVTRFAAYPVMIMNDRLIQCVTPAGDPVYGYGYKITKIRTGENYRIAITCFDDDVTFETPRERQNEHFAAYYIRNNKLMPSVVHK